MLLNSILDWLENKFSYPVPRDYIDFLKEGDLESSWRKHYVISIKDKECIEISDWYEYDDVVEIYEGGVEDGFLEKYHLPIFDSCSMVVVINCNKNSEKYGQLFLRPQEGFYDMDLDKNMYEEFEFVAKSFSELINNLKIDEEVEKLGIWEV